MPKFHCFSIGSCAATGKPCSCTCEGCVGAREFCETNGISQGDWSEATVIVNGVELTPAQSMSVRVAVSGMAEDMKKRGALGNDKHGRAMQKLYRESLVAVWDLMVPGEDT